MNAPYGERDPFGLERLVPSQHVLINAIDECAVEIEKKGRLRTLHELADAFGISRKSLSKSAPHAKANFADSAAGYDRGCVKTPVEL